MFVRALHEMVEKCKFDAALKEEQLRDRLVVGLRDKTTSRDLQLKENLTFQQAVTFARQAEAVREQMGIQCPNTSSSTPSAVDETKKQWKSNFKKKKPPQQPQGAEGVTKCKYCGGAHALDRNKCPARTAKCNMCSKTGHYAKVCRKAVDKPQPKSKKVPEVSQNFEEWHIPEVVDTLSTSDTSEPPWMVNLRVQNQSVMFKIDSGADVSIISPETYRLECPRLTPSNVKLTGAGGTSLECLGWFNASIERKGQHCQTKLCH